MYLSSEPNVVKTEQITEAWKAIDEGSIYVVQYNRALPLLEPNVSDDDQLEAVVRLFLNKNDAARYKDIMVQCGLAEPASLRVVRASLPEIFGQREEMYALAKKEYDCKFKIDVCCIFDQNGDESMWPTSIDTVFSFNAVKH